VHKDALLKFQHIYNILQGEEICVALQTHINDVMLRRYSKACSASGGSTQGDLPPTGKSSNVDVYERRVQELSRAVEESQKNADQVKEYIILTL